MSYEADPAGLGVGKSYGERDLYEGVSGDQASRGQERDIVLTFTHENYDRVAKVIPNGAVVLSATAYVDEAFAFTGGTAPTMDVGTDGSEATNGAGVDLTSTGTEVGTLAGTWADPFTADTTIGVATSGSPTSVDAGQVRVFIRYAYAG